MNKKQDEIKHRNEAMAKFLGWFKDPKGLQDTWYTWKMGFTKPAQYVAYSEHSDPYKGLPFHHDLNYLYMVLEKVNLMRSENESKNCKVGEYFIDRFEIGRKQFFISMYQWTKNGWRSSKNENPELTILYIVGENCKDWKDGLYMSISDLILAITK